MMDPDAYLRALEQDEEDLKDGLCREWHSSSCVVRSDEVTTAKPYKLNTQDAIRELRSHLGISQESLARRVDLTLKTISRYETIKPPTGKALTKFYELAMSLGRDDLAQVFREAAMEFALESIPGCQYLPKSAAEMYLQRAFEQCVFGDSNSDTANKVKELLKPYFYKIHEEHAAAIFDGLFSSDTIRSTESQPVRLTSTSARALPPPIRAPRGHSVG